MGREGMELRKRAGGWEMDKPGFTASSRMLVQLCSRVWRAAVAPCLQAEQGCTEGARGEGRSNTNPPDTDRAAAEGRNRLFFVSAAEKTRNNGLRLQRGRFCLDGERNFLIIRTIRAGR